MGHERIGILPKTHRWTGVVQQISRFSGSEPQAASIASTTLGNVRARFHAAPQDSGIRAAFEYLVALAGPSDPTPAQRQMRSDLGIPSAESPLALVKSLQAWVAKNRGSLEYAQLAQAAASDAIAIWHAENSTQKQLLPLEWGGSEVWRKAATGAGFCELARLFFAKFTERYLNYFLEREASSNCRTIQERDAFRHGIRRHVDIVSKHAFETAKITQSFAAGWYNRHAKVGVPSEQEIQRFLTMALEKMREELRREAGT